MVKAARDVKPGMSGTAVHRIAVVGRTWAMCWHIDHDDVNAAGLERSQLARRDARGGVGLMPWLRHRFTAATYSARADLR